MRDVVTAATRCTFGAEPSQMSVLWFLTLVRSAGGVNKLFEATEGAAQEYVVEQGAATIVESIAADIKNDVNIVTNQAVTSIDQTDDKELRN